MLCKTNKRRWEKSIRKIFGLYRQNTVVMMEFSLKKCLKDPKQMDQFNFSELQVQQVTFGNNSLVDLLKQSNQAKMFEASS